MQNRQLPNVYLVTAQTNKRSGTDKILANFGLTLEKAKTDTQIISPQKHITIEQIRNLKKTIFTKPLKSAYKIVIIEEAHKLTVEAQNALLKVLEEPPSCAIIIMEANHNHNLLPTILSRVVQIRSAEDDTADTKLIFTSDLEKAIANILEIENYQQALDSDIIQAYDLLKIALNNESKKAKNIASYIAQVAKAKAQIEANVSPRFSLFSLAFTLAKETENSLI